MIYEYIKIQNKTFFQVHISINLSLSFVLIIIYHLFKLKITVRFIWLFYDASILILAIITLDQTNLERQMCNTNTYVGTVLKIRIESLSIW